MELETINKQTDLNIMFQMLTFNIFNNLNANTQINTLFNSIDFRADESLQNLLYEMLQKFVEKHLSVNFKHIIKHIYKLKNVDNSLFYSVVFDKDDNYRLTFPFIRQYEQSIYNTKFPLLIQNIPNELEQLFLEDMATNEYFNKIEL